MKLSVDALNIIVYREDSLSTWEAYNLIQYEQSKENVDMMTLRKHRAPGTLCLNFMS